MVQTTDESKVGDVVGLFIEPDAIHIMKKSKYSGKFGDYSSYSDEMDDISNPDIELGEDEE
jgi:spermidine/putrescine transport system ATP-binding protein